MPAILLEGFTVLADQVTSMTNLTGWGGTNPASSIVLSASRREDLPSFLRSEPRLPVIARGLGRSYGDPAQIDSGTVVTLNGLTAFTLDDATGLLTVEAGASINQLLPPLIAQGWWLPVLPGTRQVTIGGAIASDVHGKNHHRDGSFGNHVRRMSIMLSSGDVVEAGPEGEYADLFWATVGGMGLTGVILDATIALKRIETSLFCVDSEKVPDAPKLLSVLESRDSDYQYSVAWFDASGGGRGHGRAIVELGNHAALSQLDEDVRQPLKFATPNFGGVPFRLPFSLVNRATIRVFNELWFRKAPKSAHGHLRTVGSFFHPLDVVQHWNRVYGKRGFRQYQFVLPFGTEDAVLEIMKRISASKHHSAINVIKRFGAGNAGLLSFPTPGWTIAVDFPERAGLEEFCRELDRIVLAHSGRLYFAKDSRASASTIAAMYPRLDEFRETKRKYDPSLTWQSDLSRRLELI